VAAAELDSAVSGLRRVSPGRRRIGRSVVASFSARPRRIMEVGIDSLDLPPPLLRVTAGTATDDTVHYVGLDRFEGRLATTPTGATLKQAHQALHSAGEGATRARQCRIPRWPACRPFRASLTMIVIAAVTDERHLERIWFFIQRITNARSTVLPETAGGHGAGRRQVVPKATIDESASRAVLRRAG